MALLRTALAFLWNVTLLVVLVHIALSAGSHSFSDETLTVQTVIVLGAAILAVDRLRRLIRTLVPPSSGAVLGRTPVDDGAVLLGHVAQLHRSLERRARHEAAHAVAVHELGHRIDSVSVSINGRSGGRVSWTHREGVLASVDHVAICFIGPLAEQTGDVMPATPAADDDYSVMLRTAIAASITDPEERSAASILEAASEQARHILREHSVEIESLATALVASDGTRDLTGDEVLAVLREAAPKPTLPST